MNNIRLQNFRAFKDTGIIEIKPITIFVGSNSSGKSSFLRFFPLLKQSVEESKHGPFLWYKENGVDFGNFRTTVHKGENFIKWSYSITPRYIGYLMRKIRDVLFTIEVTISRESPRTEYDFISEMRIGFRDVEIDINIERKSYKSIVKVNGVNMPSLQFHTRNGQSIFPLCAPNDNFKVTDFAQIVEILNKDEKIPINTSEDLIGYSFDIFHEKLSQKNIDEDTIVNSYNEIMYDNIPHLLYMLDVNLRLELNNLLYIGPFRDSPQRYYRAQNLSSHTIDMRGSNSAVFLSEMQKTDLSELNHELSQNYHFSLDIEKKFGQISIYIKKGGRTTNIIDNGFGYSQLLPVVLAMYAFKKSKFSSGPVKFPNTLCIEQPELHLHPSMQYEYGKTIAEWMKTVSFEKQPKIDGRIIIETHSRSIIEAIGESVCRGEVNPDSVAVYIFEQENGVTSIKRSNFDNEGYLRNWPVGFLD